MPGGEYITLTPVASSVTTIGADPWKPPFRE
jgi:hypothetical protein